MPPDKELIFCKSFSKRAVGSFAGKALRTRLLTKLIKMKYIKLSSILLLMAFMLLGIACENADLQKSSPTDQTQILPRGECEGCSDDELCCCELILAPMAPTALLRLCGTDDGVGSCSGTPPDPCDDFNDGGQNATLSINSPKHEFCMAKNSPFSITNVGIYTASFSIVCWDQLSAVDQEIGSLDPSEVAYFFIDGDCDVEPCE